MEKVIWREGMLLRPQHLQQQDRFYAHQQKTLLNQAQSFNWGFYQLEIDQQYLMMGKVVISHASGILPDGTLFSIQGDQAPAIDVPKDSYDAQVYLVLPIAQVQAAECRLEDEEDALTPWVAIEKLIYDTNHGSNHSNPTLCARHDFRILIETEQNRAMLQEQNHWVRLPLCRIADFSADSVVTLDEHYQPPYLHIGGCAAYLRYGREVINLLANRAEVIAGRLRSHGRFGGSELGDFLMLTMINRYETELRHLFQLKQVHPERLFLSLASLAAELTTFNSETRRPDDALLYSHTEQYRLMTDVMHVLRQQLSQVIEQHVVSLPLQQRKYGIQVSPLQDRTLLDSAQFILAASAECEQEQLRQRLPAQMKIGPVEQIRQMVNLHLPGIGLKALASAPRQLPYQANHIYFALEFDSTIRSQFETSGGFALHVAGEFPGLDLHLWAVRNN